MTLPRLRWIGIGALLMSLGPIIAFGLSKSENQIRGDSFKSPSLGLMTGQFLFTAIGIMMVAASPYSIGVQASLGS